MSLAREITGTGMRRHFAAASFLRDCRGIAAVEFAVIVPVMLVFLFATVEFGVGLAVDRKVSLVARTIANLTSQGTNASTTDLTNYIGAGSLIMSPYLPAAGYPAPNMTISELYIDPTTGIARVEWSWGSSPRTLFSPYAALPQSMIATDPTTHAILPNQYIIVSEVNTLYTPTLGFFGVMSGAISLSDVAYALPRQSTCVIGPAATSTTCPTG